METKVIKNIKLNIIESDSIIKEVYSFLELLEDEYPNFKEWYFKKVVQEIGFSRQLLLKYLKKELVGVAILKQNQFESKICTFRVKDEFQGLGIGSKMIQESFGLLNTYNPNITVSERRIGEFNRILTTNGFQLDAIYPDYYIQGQKEYSFNGLIEGITPHNKVYKTFGELSLY
ncbi:GNAT family N-acetyltransferase [Prolixibacteraceae bacterium JC049]|nr:GNAT family N-acetyltransferase [Prolixibacteraceae bacterium JC049]